MTIASDVKFIGSLGFDPTTKVAQEKSAIIDIISKGLQDAVSNSELLAVTPSDIGDAVEAYGVSDGNYDDVMRQLLSLYNFV